MNRADFLEEQTIAGGSGLRALKTTGDPQWCWQTISRLQSLWVSLNLDFESYMTAWAEAEEHEVWEKVPYDNPFGSKDEMLHQLEIGDETAAKNRVACQAIAARALRTWGRRRDKDDQDYTRKLDSGNKSNYLVARIARDRPDILERMKKGEFPSMAEAARAAGIRTAKPRKTVTLSDKVERVAERLKGHYTPEQIQQLRDHLGDTG